MVGNAESIFMPRYRSLSVGMIALVALFVFETLGVATAMPAVAKALDGLSLYGLAFAGAMAASVVGMTVAGGMADAHGPRAPLRLGVTWFAIGLLMAGLAPTMWMLLLGRIVQGFGGGLMSVALHVVVGRVYPPTMHARIFTAFATAYVLPAVIGPIISGLLVEHAGWRWVFLAVPPVAVVAMRLMMPALRAVDAPPPGEAAGGNSRRRTGWAIGAAGSLCCRIRVEGSPRAETGAARRRGRGGGPAENAVSGSPFSGSPFTGRPVAGSPVTGGPVAGSAAGTKLSAPAR